MSLVYCVFLLVTIACRINAIDGPLRAYGLRKDFFNGIKAAEFSVFDTSKYTFMPKFDLIAHPSKKVVGKLESKFGSITISLLDDKTGQWITGSMKKHITLLKQYEYTIEFNGRQISMIKELLSAHTNFRVGSQDGNLLARFQREFFSPITATTYGVQVYSNTIPDGLYLLALTWADIGRSESYGIKQRRIRHLHS
jgi:hypothetical protein